MKHKSIKRKSKSRRTKATDITADVKQTVFLRDKGMCVVCGNMYNVMPNAHIVPRSQGGKGIETNIVTLCTNMTENKCHYIYDFGTKEQVEEIDKKIVEYMKSIYSDKWCKEDQIYKKYEELK